MIVLTLVSLVILVISLSRFLYARFETLGDRLTRIEDALGAEDWVEFLRGALGTDPEELEQKGIVGRLERIEAALNPLARARQQVNRVKRELDEALKEDPASGYAHWQVSKIEELIQKGEQPDRKDWESWIGTPFPWG